VKVYSRRSRRTRAKIGRHLIAPRMQRLIAIAGLVFIVFVAASIVVLPNGSDGHESAAKAVTFYQAHKTATGVTAHLIVLAVFIGVFFFWQFRNLIAVTDASRHRATIGFAGALLFAVSGATAAASYYTLNETIGHADPSTIKTLFQADFANGIGAVGVAVFLIASSVAIIRGRRLPQGLAWLGIVLRVAYLVLIGVGLPALGLWLLLTCITMLVHANSGSATTVTGDKPALA
jgi:hypothetical protein